MRNLGLGDSFGNLEDLGLDLTVEKTTSLYGTGEKTTDKHAYLYGGIEEKNVYKTHDARTNYLTDTGNDVRHMSHTCHILDCFLFHLLLMPD